MKVLLLTHIFPSEQRPTHGVFNGNVFRALSRSCETRIVVPQPWWTQRPKQWRGIPSDQYAGIQAVYPTYWSIPRFPRLHAQGMYQSLRAPVAHLRREFRFDAILAAWAYPDATAAALLARDFGCPLVIKVLGSDLNEMPRNPALSSQIRWGLSQAQRVVAVSKSLRDQAITLGVSAERVVVQHNGVDGATFRPRDRYTARRTLDLPLNRPVVCYVGRLSHEKGVDVLIRAFGEIRRSGRSDVLLTLVGAGAAEVELQALVKEMGLEAQVRFCGNRAHHEIPTWISAADVFCLPSRREGCPNVVLEALASGRPVVASSVGGLPELVQANNGILVPPEAPEALAEGIQEALSRHWEEDALRNTVQFLSWNHVGAAYFSVLQDACGEWYGTGSSPVRE